MFYYFFCIFSEYKTAFRRLYAKILNPPVFLLCTLINYEILNLSGTKFVNFYFFLGAAFLAAGFLAAFLAAGFLAAFLAGFLAAGFLAAFFGFLAAFLAAGFLAFFGFLALGFLAFLTFFGFSALTTLYDPAPLPDALAILRAPLATPRLRAKRIWTAALAASTL